MKAGTSVIWQDHISLKAGFQMESILFLSLVHFSSIIEILKYTYVQNDQPFKEFEDTSMKTILSWHAYGLVSETLH